MVSKDALRSILAEGRRLNSEQYYRHCRENHAKTFYFFCLRLSRGRSNSTISSTELNEFIFDELKRRKIIVNDKFNPQGWFGQAWTDWNDPAKNERHFRDEYCEVLARTGIDPYAYQIRSNYFQIIKDIFDNFESPVASVP